MQKNVEEHIISDYTILSIHTHTTYHALPQADCQNRFCLFAHFDSVCTLLAIATIWIVYFCNATLAYKSALAN